MHWGLNGVTAVVPAYEIDVAHAAIDAGADETSLERIFAGERSRVRWTPTGSNPGARSPRARLL
jgi:hypothetical protein